VYVCVYELGFSLLPRKQININIFVAGVWGSDDTHHAFCEEGGASLQVALERLAGKERLRECKRGAGRSRRSIDRGSAVIKMSSCNNAKQRLNSS
jgi:hypothetical protein